MYYVCRWLWHIGGAARGYHLVSTWDSWKACECSQSEYFSNFFLLNFQFIFLEYIIKCAWMILGLLLMPVTCTCFAGGAAQRRWLLQPTLGPFWQGPGRGISWIFSSEHCGLCSNCQWTSWQNGGSHSLHAILSLSRITFSRVQNLQPQLYKIIALWLTGHVLSCRRTRKFMTGPFPNSPGKMPLPWCTLLQCRAL